MGGSEKKCIKCGAKLLQDIAVLTGGLCMGCRIGKSGSPDPNAPLEVSFSCRTEPVLSQSDLPNPIFHIPAQKLLKRLEETRPFSNDPQHPNQYELEAQRALLRYAIQYRINFQLKDDGWGRTGYAIFELFDIGEGIMEFEGQRYSSADLTKEDWCEGEQYSIYGGYLYKNKNNKIVFNLCTWIE